MEFSSTLRLPRTRPVGVLRLEQGLDPRRNSINAIRLGLAFLVLVSHSVQLSLGGADPLGGVTGSAVDLGTMAVDGFFALSGFLIVGSYINSRSMGRYLWRRCLRILPAFWVCLLVSALVIGPLTAVLASGDVGGYRWTGPMSSLSYIRDNAALLIRQYEIVGGYDGNVVNGSLHTLFYEFLCYLAAAVAGVLGLYRLRRGRTTVVVAGSWLLVVLALLAVPTVVVGHAGREMLFRFGSMFLFGALAHLLQHRIRLVPIGYLVAAVAVVAGVWGSVLLGAERGLVAYTLLAAPATAYLVLSVGASTRLAHIGAKRDLSYGLYVYAWPVQITLLVIGAANWWVPAYVAASLAVSLGLAYLSWTWIEAPSLRLKSWTPRALMKRARPSG